MTNSIVFGPVPSRRLGRSLGINHIPPKLCSYSCVYCQLGTTHKTQAERKHIYEPEKIACVVKDKIERIIEKGESIDYLTFVPDGEPSLDVNLGQEIDLLKEFDKKVAVITNASLIWREDVRKDLQKADWVSLKLDAISEDIWRRIDNPQQSLELGRILEGIIRFRSCYRGLLATESMLIHGVNDNAAEISKMADFLATLNPDIAYISIPTRPPAVKSVTAASEKTINMAYQIFKQRSPRVELLVGYEGNTFSLSGDTENDLLSITAVHPMREDAVIEFLGKSGVDWGLVTKLIGNGKLIELTYQGRKFYMRQFRHV